MKEFVGDIWTFASQQGADAIVITTNGSVRKDGKAVMGRGIAKEAAELFPWLPAELASKIRSFGNRGFVFHTSTLTLGNMDIITLPVKHEWHQNADLELIRKSVERLVYIADTYNLEFVVMPRPGCGNGKLEWEIVKEEIEPMLDDRFWVGHV